MRKNKWKKRDGKIEDRFYFLELYYYIKDYWEKIYTDKIKFLYDYHEYHLLNRKIRRIYEEKRKPQQHHYNVIDLVLEEIISADEI